ncbi:hypothetical protein K435DRAFT_40559 [Dendrothele bispora CBS 962.96]|uniref:Uncharacterized protein n=1 Tax=Dendrothele bispora (strain CBS 962.96) TaxID=1314807 RepID=A0A4S8MS71_DENBC|nr:hypothetical protein K435DRAFT_40559 [Dendrothele bispora CBS 962.96]
MNQWEDYHQNPDDWLLPTPQDTTKLTKEQLRDREHRHWADTLQEFIPFWLRTIDAATRGEVLKLSDFFDSLEQSDDTWPPHGSNPWAYPDAQSRYGGLANRQTSNHSWHWGSANKHDDAARWGIDEGEIAPKWDAGHVSHSSGASCKATGFHRQNLVLRDVSAKDYNFVEDIARQEAVDGIRKQKMHTFFELPTDEKVKRIHALIHTLRSTS